METATMTKRKQPETNPRRMPKPESERAEQVSVSLYPEEIAYLRRYRDDNRHRTLSLAMQKMIQDHQEQNERKPNKK